MVRLSAGAESLGNEPYRSSVKVVAVVRFVQARTTQVLGSMSSEIVGAKMPGEERMVLTRPPYRISPSHGENRGFESPRERQKYQRITFIGQCWCPVCVPLRSR